MGELTAQEFHFADFTLDQSRYRLQRGEDILRLEKLPMELLILLVQRRGELVSREEIAERLWGKDVFLDIDRSINTAISKVRLALRDDPEKPRFVETVVGKGYRFAAPVTGNGDSHLHVALPALPVQVSLSPTVASIQGKASSTRMKLLFVGVSVIALFTIGWVVWRGGATRSSGQPAIKSLAVLPLKNLSGDPAQEYFADGMTESLIGRLSAIHDLRVTSRTSVMQFKDTRMSAPEIAKKLDVDALLEGSVIRQGSHVRVHAQLIRGATDEHFWSEEYDRDVGDTLALESEVAQSVARKVEVTITGKEHERLVAARHVAPEVYENYLKGQFAQANTKAEIEESVGHFEEAIRKDPTFAPAYVGLASAHARLGTMFIGGHAEEERRKVVSVARKALELDPEVAEAHVLLADTLQKQWQWAEAEAEYKRALQLKPNDAAAHAGFADWLLCQGRTDEALAWVQRARELDPIGVSGNNTGWALFQARRYDEALQELRSAAAARPDNPDTLWYFGFALMAKNQNEEAIGVLEKAASIMHRSPGPLELLGTAYARAGHRGEALRVIDELKRRRQTDYVPAGSFVFPYLAVHDYDQAFVWMERAYQEKAAILMWLKVHPFFDPVRGDPRFKDLLHRVGLDR